MIGLKVKYNNVWTDLDLYGDESIRLNKSVLEVQDISSRTSTFSRQFRLPGTSINNQVFNHIFKINSDSSFDVKAKTNCILTHNENVLVEGFIRLERLYVNVDRNDYEVVIYTQLTDLSSSVREKTLKDLNLNEYSHNFSFENIQKSWYNDLFDGDIVYPFLSYGVDDEDNIPDLSFGTITTNRFDNSSTPLPHTYFKPSIRAQVLVKKIIEEAGFTLSSDFINGDHFKKIYMPLTFNDEYTPNIVGDNTFLATHSANVPISGNSWIDVPFDTLERGSNYDVNTNKYTIPIEGQYHFRVSYDLSTTDCCSGSVDWVFQDMWEQDSGFFSFPYWRETRQIENICNVSSQTITKDIIFNAGSSTSSALFRVGDEIGFNISLLPFLCYNYTLTNDGTGPATFSYIPCNQEDRVFVNVDQGQTKQIQAKYFSAQLESGTGSIIDNGQIVPTTDCDAVISNLSFECITAPAGSGSTITIDDNMDDGITQLDFLKSIFTYFNMVVEPDADDPTILHIEPWKDWIASGETKDWSDYINTNKDITIQPVVDNENRYVLFADEADDDVLNKKWKDNNGTNFGELLFDSGSEILTNTKTIETIFSPTPAESLLGSTEFIVPKLYEEDADGNQEVISTKPRLLYWHGLKDLENNKVWYIWDSFNGPIYPMIKYPRMLSVESLSNINQEDLTIRTLSWNKVLDYYTGTSQYDSTLYAGSLYETYWKEYMVDIYDSKSRLAIGYFNLPLEEFNHIKLNDKIILGGIYGNTIWRINKIIDYDVVDNQGEVKIELIKALNAYQLQGDLPDPTPAPELNNYIVEICDSTERFTISTDQSLTIGGVYNIITDNGLDYCFNVIGSTTSSGVNATEIVFYDNCNLCLGISGKMGLCINAVVDVSGFMENGLVNGTSGSTPTPTPTATPTPTPTPVFAFNITQGPDPCNGGNEFLLYGTNSDFASNSVLYTNPSLTNVWSSGPTFLLINGTNTYYEYDGEMIIGSAVCPTPTPIPSATPTPTPTATPTPTPTPVPVVIYTFNVTDGPNPCSGGSEYTLYGTNSDFSSNTTLYTDAALNNAWSSGPTFLLVNGTNTYYEYDGENFISSLLCPTPTPVPTATPTPTPMPIVYTFNIVYGSEACANIGTPETLYTTESPSFELNTNYYVDFGLTTLWNQPIATNIYDVDAGVVYEWNGSAVISGPSVCQVYSFNIILGDGDNNPCNGGSELTVYGLDPTFLDNNTLFTNSSLTNNWTPGPAQIILVNGVDRYEWDGQDYVASLGPCPTPTPTPTPVPTATPTPTPIPVYSFNITDGPNPCVGGSEYTLYGTNSNLVSNTTLYTDPGLNNVWSSSATILLVNGTGIRYEWDGSQFIANLGPCPTPTPTPTPAFYSWNVVMTDMSGDPCVGGDELTLYTSGSSFGTPLYTDSALTNLWGETNTKKLLVNGTIYEYDGEFVIGTLGSCP